MPGRCVKHDACTLSVSLRALTRNLILCCESRQDGMPDQVRQDTVGIRRDVPLARLYYFDTHFRT